MTSRWETILVNNKPMEVYISEPEGPGPYPGVIVIQEAFGVTNHIERVSDRYSEAGYVVIAPDLYYRKGSRITLGYDESNFAAAFELMESFTTETLLNDLNATIEHLNQHAKVKETKLGMVGFCVGGRITYLAASSFTQLEACIVYYGGRIGVPFGEGLSPLEGTSSISCPIMGNFGELDGSPSPKDVGIIEAELTKHGKSYDFKIFPGATHGFNCDERSSFHPQVSEEAWSRSLGFFAQHLASTA